MRVVSFNGTHDSSVCSYVDGKIEFYCKEERLSRIKRDFDPYRSLDLYHQQNFGPIDHFLYLTPTNDNPAHFSFSSDYIRKKFGVNIENFSSLKHHDCHASIAFYNSGFSEALVFVIDRNGSVYFDGNDSPLARESESVYKASYPDNFCPLYKSFWAFDNTYKYEVKKILEDSYKSFSTVINFNNAFSIVKVYESATTLIGQHPLENGKTMGLSSYGKDISYPPLFMDGCAIDNYFSSMADDNASACFYGYEENITEKVTEENYQFYANKAKHVQIETQKEALRLIDRYVTETGIKNVCLVGGYGLNVVANNYYIKSLPDINFYFEPVADDSGITVGASMLKYRNETKDDKIYKIEDNFYHFYKKSDIPTNSSHKKENKKLQDIVDILKAQNILAVFQGAPEAGPRALGHRSLLFDPRNKNGKDIVNVLKKREWYRPFAGIILEDQFPNYFKTLGLKRSEYMTINFECQDGVSDYVPSIVHVDNTCRIQTVSEKDEFIFELLSLFYEQTRCPMLLNTSFNLAGEPLVHSEADALQFIDNIKGNSAFSGVYFVDEKCLVSSTSMQQESSPISEVAVPA